MALELIDLAAVVMMANEQAVTATAIVETNDGWNVRVTLGSNERTLATPGTANPRTWSSATACAAFLAQEAGILHVEVRALDGESASPVDVDYDAWLRSAVGRALDDPGPGVPAEELERDFDTIKSAFRKRLTTGQT